MSKPFSMSPLALWNKIFGHSVKASVETPLTEPAPPEEAKPTPAARRNSVIHDPFDDAESVTDRGAAPRQATPTAKRHVTRPPLHGIPPDPSNAD